MEDRRLIEETFPVREVSVESVKEKNIRHGHISTLHIWWARRPLAASRATIYAALTPPLSNKEEWKKKREFIAALSKWENSSNMDLIEKARKEILDASGGKPPRVLDPFAGGGSIPLEALRLGCETYASDYNPVATLILKCTLEYPQKYGHKLIDDVKKWGKWVSEEAEKELGRFYPVCKDGSIPVGYIWARTIPCQNPSCNAELPLMRQFWLAKKGKDREISLFPFVSKKTVQFKIVGKGYEKKPVDFDPSKGTVHKAIANCLVCGSTVDGKTTSRLFREGKASQRMIAVVTYNHRKNGKSYRIADASDVEAFNDAEKFLETKRKALYDEWGIDPVPDEPTPEGKGRGAERAFSIRNYNMNTWGDLFNSRQKLALITFVEKVREAHEKMSKEGYDGEYAMAVTNYLALTFDRMAMSYNVLTQWQAGYEKMGNAFSRQALPMVWDYAEPNASGEGVRSWNSLFQDTLRVIHHCLLASMHSIRLSQNSATLLEFPDNHFDAVFTDPPYYDNVPYSYLSDFFYVWLKRSIGSTQPDIFCTPLTPKSQEIVAYANITGGLDSAKRRFEDKLREAFAEINRVVKTNGIVIIVYAHKSTSGWETLINSLIDSHLIVTGAWPIHTERKTRIRGQESAALASSIYMIARKTNREPIGFFNIVKQELSEHLVRKLDQIWNEGISGADFFISAIGSSIEVFGKYEKVIDDEGETVRSDRLLEIIRRIVTDYAIRQVLHNGFATEIQPLTRFYVLWRWAYGDAVVEFDEARKLGQSVGIEVSNEWNKGFIIKEKEFIKVAGPDERKLEDMEHSTEMIDVLHKVLVMWKKGKTEEMTKILSESGYGKTDVFYRVAQAISESLPIGNSEKKLLEGFLAGKERILKETVNQAAQTRWFE
ncbi:MAG: DUF1156 domain-containing protein [Nitrososphaerota archaeon]|nr:DUF1156 domain-containing protein [Nitrososphaerota archaeon]